MMKHLKLGIMAGLCASIGLVQAQEKTKLTPEEKAEKATAYLENELGLSADQRAAVYDATLDLTKALKPAREQKDTAAIKAARQQYKAAMKGILSQEQMDKWKAIKKERMKKQKARKEEGNDAGSTIEELDF